MMKINDVWSCTGRPTDSIKALNRNFTNFSWSKCEIWQFLIRTTFYSSPFTQSCKQTSKLIVIWFKQITSSDYWYIPLPQILSTTDSWYSPDCLLGLYLNMFFCSTVFVFSFLFFFVLFVKCWFPGSFWEHVNIVHRVISCWRTTGRCPVSWGRTVWSWTPRRPKWCAGLDHGIN